MLHIIITVLIILIDYHCLQVLKDANVFAALIVTPVIGRFVCAACFSIMSTRGESSDTDEGKFLAHCDWGVFVIASFELIVILFLAYNFAGLLIYLFALVFCYILAFASHGKGIGVKEKLCVASVEISQTLFLIIMTIAII